MVDKNKVVVILLIAAILFSVISTVLTLSVMNNKPVQNQPKVIYTGKAIQGDPNSGIKLVVLPTPGSSP